MTQTNELYTTIALGVVAILATIYLLRQIVLFAHSRPDLLALLSGTAIVIGGFLLLDPAQQQNGLITAISGLIFLMMAALNYRHFQGGK